MSASDIRKTRDAIRAYTNKNPLRLAGSRADRDLGDAGYPGGGRVRLRLRLGARR